MLSLIYTSFVLFPLFAARLMLFCLVYVLSCMRPLSYILSYIFFFFFSSRRRHTRYIGDWSSDVCSSDLGAPSNQVLLRVRFAEVSRSALTELGVSFFTSPDGQFHNVIGRVTTGQYPAPTFDSQSGGNKLIFSDFLNFFIWDFKNDLGAVVKALQTRGLFQSLAEPNLVAES